MILHLIILGLTGSILLATLAAAIGRSRVIWAGLAGAATGAIALSIVVFPLTCYPLEGVLRNPVPSFYLLGEFYPARAWVKIAGGIAGALMATLVEIYRTPRRRASAHGYEN